jgi:restriction system protein
MAIPLQKSVELPLLKALDGAGGQLKIKEVGEKVEKYFQELTDEDKASRLESGGNRWINRVQWARQRLIEKGEVDSPERGVWRITDLGRARLEKEWSEWRPEYSQRDFTTTPSEPIPITREELLGDPREELENARETLIGLVKKEISKRVQELSPSLFESLVAQLLEKLGYGNVRDGSIKVTGRSGDEGVDGECCLDPLGLHKVLFQAKRWATPVGPSIVRDFIGALDTHRVDRGVLISTSGFTTSAKDEASRSGKVKLIDGKELAGMMIQCNLGVQKRTLDIPIIDEDYFAGLT